MRSSKSHTDRLIEVNFREILKMVPGEKKLQGGSKWTYCEER